MPYHFDGTAPRAPSRDAAAANAAHAVLVALYPQIQQPLDAQFAQSLAAVPDGPAKTAGLAAGARAARAILSELQLGRSGASRRSAGEPPE